MENKTVCGKPDARLEKTKTMVLTGLLFAVSIVLSVVENTFPQISAVPGVKLGLSNIGVMYSLFFLGKGQAFSIAVLKALFVFATRGLIAAVLSLCGGLLSVSVMLIVMFVFKNKISYLMASIFGALSHNIGQFIAIYFIYTNMYIISYLPLLLISGVIAGTATATLLRFILPAFNKLGLK